MSLQYIIILMFIASLIINSFPGLSIPRLIHSPAYPFCHTFRRADWAAEVIIIVRCHTVSTDWYITLDFLHT